MEVDIYYGDQSGSADSTRWTSDPIDGLSSLVYIRQTQTRARATGFPNEEGTSIVMDSAINALREDAPDNHHSGALWKSLAIQVKRAASKRVLSTFIRALSFEINSSPRVHGLHPRHHQSISGPDVDQQEHTHIQPPENLANEIGTENFRLGRQGSSAGRPSEADVDHGTKVDILAVSLLSQFHSTQNAEDINYAIDLWTTEINTTNRTHPQFHRRMDRLAECYTSRALVSSSNPLEDLDHAIRLTDDIVGCIPPNHPNQSDFMMSLATRLSERFKIAESKSDIDRAIHTAKAAVLLTRYNHPLRPLRLEVHGSILCQRFERYGSIEDLQSALAILGRGLNLPENHPVLPGIMGLVGRCLGNMYDYTGSPDDLNQAIDALSVSVSMMSQQHPHLPVNLNRLGSQLSRRHELTGSLDDIELSIRTLQRAAGMAPEGDSFRTAVNSSIAISLELRYLRTGLVANLNDAISMMDTVIQATPQGDPAYIGRVANLGVFLRQRYEKHRFSGDLDRSIKMSRAAVDVLSETDMKTSLALNMKNLAFGLFKRSIHTDSMDDLDEAIATLKTAAALLPENHPELGFIFENLIKCYAVRGNVAIDDQLQISLRGWRCQNSPPSARIPLASVAAGLLNLESRWEEANEILEGAISLLPSVSPRTLKSSDQQHMLRKFPGLASLATSTALNAGKSPVDALNLLEAGRGVMAAVLFETRVEIDDLTKGHEHLANRFVYLRNQLDKPPSTDYSRSADETEVPLEVYANMKQRRELELQFNEVISEIRSKPGFDTFLRQPKAEDLLAAASSGPIVVLNASMWRCDAFIIDTSSIQLLPLPLFGHTEIKSGIEIDSVSLENLWDIIARPILEKLGFLEPPKDGHLPHVWWVLTGSLSRLPIHAAGYHQEGCHDTVMDLVVSSYSTSINALLQSRQKSTRITSRNVSHQACLVTMGTTPSNGQLSPSDLEFVEEEVQILDSLLSPSIRTTLLDKPEKDEVLRQIETCTTFHFAGHGITDPLDPSKSCLLLKDWVRDPLSFENLISLNLFEKHAWLAYLSACSTGENQAEKLQDESIHLVSACQLAGFPHVVGSLWKVDDKSSAEAAAEVYRTIKERGWTDESVALGVHNAARLLRSKTRREGQDRARGLGYAVRDEGNPSIWAAYIHVGP